MKTPEIIAAAINFAALLFVGAQVMLARRTLRANGDAQQREWSRLRKQSTIETVFSTEEYRESLKATMPKSDRDSKQVAAWLKEANGDFNKLSPVRQYFNHLNDLAVGTKQGILDLETLSMLQGSRIIGTVESYIPFIHYIRRELHSPSTYEDIEELAEMLRVHRKGKV